MNPTLRCFDSFETLQTLTIFKAFYKIYCAKFTSYGIYWIKSKL